MRSAPAEDTIIIAGRSPRYMAISDTSILNGPAGFVGFNTLL